MSSLASWLQRHVSPRIWLRLLEQRNRLLASFQPEPFRSALPFTMLGMRRLRNLHALARKIDDLGIAGDVVECGTCNGGSGAVLAHAASQSPHQRHVWLLDSFEGLPEPGLLDGGYAKRYAGECCGNPPTVRMALDRVGVPQKIVTLVQGWFQDTIATLPVEKIGLLHIDADFFESVRVVLEGLYDRVSQGGFIILDDYGTWEGCRRACDEFLAARSLSVPLTSVDGHAVYFAKP